MNVVWLLILLCFLIVLSGFFSASETGMMALNRYRLRHRAQRKNERTAQRVMNLLRRPDRLLGVILLGNTFANILASAVATMIASHFFGEVGVWLGTVLLTVIVLIFAETTPKTLATYHADRVAYFVSFPLRCLLYVLYPLVYVINIISNGVLALFRVRIRGSHVDPVTVEELKMLVYEATGKISNKYKQMLLRILSLDQLTIEDVMVPCSEIYGINLAHDWNTIKQQLIACCHAYVPLYRGHIDQVCGLLNLRKVLIAMQKETLDQDRLVKLVDPVSFIPSAVLTSKQLSNFQREQKSIGLVVNEYGQIQGLVTIQDILEEIVGEFALDKTSRAR